MELMPGYKHSEVGVIPEDWEDASLGEIAEIRMCKRIFMEQTSPSGGIPFFKIGTFGRTPDAFISGDIYREYKRKYSFPQKGDILLSAAGTLGKTVIYDGEEAYFQDSNIVWLDIDRRKITNEYLYQCYQKIKWASPEGSTISRLYNGIIRNTKIPLPPTESEQRAIAKALSDVDALLATLDQVIAKKRDLKLAAMQQLLTGKTRLPGFSGEWEVKQLGEVASFFKGKGLSKSAISESGAEHCIHYGELFTRYPELIGEIYSRTDSFAGAFRSVSNDVLMPTSDVTPRGLAKASCITSDDVILGGDILVIRSDTALICGSFLSFLIRYEEAKILKLVTGSTVYHLYGCDMVGFTFSMPSLPEQTAIATALSDMNVELSVLETRREKTRNLKQAMMQELLTGKTRLVAKEESHV